MHYHVLILSLTCNIPYFRKLAHVVKQTWAKDVIDGRFSDCCWFAYTACDENHKEPCIDFDDHMIYVDCEDDRNHTYEKIQLAYKALTDFGITCDYVLHTNVSTYVNLDLLLPKIYALKEHDIIGIGFPWRHRSNVDGTETFRWPAIAGHCMCHPIKLWEIGMSATNDYDEIPATDDVIISGKINEVVGWENLNIINPNPSEYADFPLYKPIYEDPYRVIVKDPKVVKTCSAIILKQDFETLEERCEKENEIKYFYELYKEHKHINKHYKVLFLTMSCNIPFFEMARKVVADTWAKPIIEGKYPECGFYSYTASKNGQNYIEDNCVYVNCKDDPQNTYTKTLSTLKFLKEQGITWDVVVRTNASVYINVEKTIELINGNENYIQGFLFNIFGFYIPIGYYMFMPNELTDNLLLHFDELNENFVPDSIITPSIWNYFKNKCDDVLIGLFTGYLKIKYGINVPIKVFDDIFSQHYKSFIRNPFIQNPKERQGVYANGQNSNPEAIFKYPFLQIRLAGVYDNNHRYIELESMYEINEIKNGK